MLGLGEIVAVLNGVEFRTHHNDYHLRSRHPTDRRHGKFADIAFPDVPDEVTRLPEVEDQIAEMREWFKAWRDENPQPRNYEKYFKPVMCYLEGMWTKDQERDKINSHFPKDPHQINAKTWEQLSEKVIYFVNKTILTNLRFSKNDDCLWIKCLWCIDNVIYNHLSHIYYFCRYFWLCKLLG